MLVQLKAGRPGKLFPDNLLMRVYTKQYANKTENNRRRLYSMRSKLITILLSGIVLSVALS